MEEEISLSPSGEELVLSHPLHSATWPNYMGNDSTIATFTAGGHGLLKLQNQSGVGATVLEAPSRNQETNRAVYIRDNDTGEFWTINVLAGERNVALRTIRHRPYESVIECNAGGVDATWRIFVPTTGSMEIWQIHLKNQSSGKRRLSLFFLANVCQTATPSSAETSFSNDVLTITDRVCLSEEKPVVFFTTDRTAHSFDASREAFIGPNGSFALPKAVRDGKCSRSSGNGGTPVAVIEGNCTLGPKAESYWNAFLGGVFVKPNETPRQVQQKITTLLKPYRQPRAIEEARQTVGEYYKKLLRQSQLSTPEDTLHRYYNHFMRYQLLARAAWPTVEEAEKTTQHVSNLASQIAPWQPEKAKNLLEEVLQKQVQEGGLASRWLGQNIFFEPAREVEDCLATAISALNVIKETGELSWLKQRAVPYLDGKRASIIEHLTRLVESLLDRLSPSHFLVVNGEERTAATAQLVWILRELVPVLNELNDTASQKRYLRLVKEIGEGVNKKLTEGGYYNQGRRNGQRHGLKKTEYGFELAAQSWAIISGLADSKKAKRLIGQLAKDFPTGLPSFWPPFAHFSALFPEFFLRQCC